MAQSLNSSSTAYVLDAKLLERCLDGRNGDVWVRRTVSNLPTPCCNLSDGAHNAFKLVKFWFSCWSFLTPAGQIE
jgi:hypothetical protein